jgi:type I restriction enzyme S subunit
MPNEVKLGELAIIESGYAFKSSDWTTDGNPVVKIKNVKDGHVSLEDCAYVSDEIAAKASKFLAYEGDILLSLTGYVGQVGRVEIGDVVLVNQRVGFVKPKDDGDKSFVYHLLRSLRKEVEELGTGTAQANVAPRDIMNLQVPNLEPSFRRTIGVVLDSFDSRIGLNTKISKTLDEIAQAVYKSWFIDFDPVKLKMNGERPVGMDDATAALFPDSMENSELGMVPTGWTVHKLGDVCSTAIGGLWGKDSESADSPSPYRCIRGVDMDDLKHIGFAPRTPLRWDKAHNHERRSLNGLSILIAGSGAGPVGKSLLWDESMSGLFDGPVIYSNFVKRFECESRAIASFVSSVLSQMYSSGEMFIYVNGTSVPNLQDAELLNAKKIVLPSEGVLQKFDSLIRLNANLKFNGNNRTLAEIRDALLPRLISGELQIPEEMLVS